LTMYVYPAKLSLIFLLIFSHLFIKCFQRTHLIKPNDQKTAPKNLEEEYDDSDHKEDDDGDCEDSDSDLNFENSGDSEEEDDDSDHKEDDDGDCEDSDFE
jgi:hypothetical protein